MKRGVCKRGHRMSKPGTYDLFYAKVKGHDGEVVLEERHRCRKCRRRYQFQRRRAAGVRPVSNHCPSGHLYDEANTVMRKGRTGNPVRMCRECKRERDRLWASRLRSPARASKPVDFAGARFSSPFEAA